MTTPMTSTPLPAPTAPWDYPSPHIISVMPGVPDIDGLNHTNNAVYVQWCETVAWAHSGSLGLGIDEYQQLDRGMAIRHASYDYLLPSSLDEPLLIGTWLTASDGKVSLERRFQIIRAANGETLLRARWHLVCIELSSGRPRRMPDVFRERYLGALIVPAEKPAV